MPVMASVSEVGGQAVLYDQFSSFRALCRPGGFGEETEPDPIPNSAVKLLCADGTMSQDLGE